MKKAIVLILGAMLFAQGPVFAGPMQDTLQVHAQYEQARHQSAPTPITGENEAFDALLSSSEDRQEIPAMVPGLNESVRGHLIDRIRFDILHENRNELVPVLDSIQKTLATKGELSNQNMLGIPLRVGKLELSFMFVKKYGSIVRCDKERFQATLDTMSVDVVPDPKNPGRVIAIFSGSSAEAGPLPQGPMGGKITTDGTSAAIIADDGTTIQVTHKGKGTYKFSSNKLPVSVNAKYID